MLKLSVRSPKECRWHLRHTCSNIDFAELITANRPSAVGRPTGRPAREPLRVSACPSRLALTPSGRVLTVTHVAADIRGTTWSDLSIHPAIHPSGMTSTFCLFVIVWILDRAARRAASRQLPIIALCRSRRRNRSASHDFSSSAAAAVAASSISNMLQLLFGVTWRKRYSNIISERQKVTRCSIRWR